MGINITTIHDDINNTFNSSNLLTGVNKKKGELIQEIKYNYQLKTWFIKIIAMNNNKELAKTICQHMKSR